MSALLGAVIQIGSYIRILIVLELLLTAGGLATLHLGAENNLGTQGLEYLNSLTLLTVTGTEAVLGLSLLALAQMSISSHHKI